VRAGKVHALLGENGAGKTTLMRIAFGLLAPDDGSVLRDGRRVRYGSPADAIGDGIGMVHQHFSLVPAMTVAENVALGGRGRFSPVVAEARVRAAADAAGFALDPRARVATLSVAMQQRVEILKALAHNAKVLILDEPTAVLPPAEARVLLTQLRAYASAGRAVVLITHKLREALESADDVSVLRRGVVVLSGPAAHMGEPEIVEAMVGSRPTPPPRTAREPGPPVLSLTDVSVRADGVDRLVHANLVVHACEIVGVAGVEGNGQRELLRVLSGRLAPTAGRVAIPAEVGFVPEDRHRDGMIGEFSLAENFALAGAGARRGVVEWSAMRTAAAAVMSEFDVRASGPDAPASALSGGNQQRFVLGRALRTSPVAIVAENPSRGLDVQATVSVHAQLRSARDGGAAVVVYTSDLDELLELADRVVVCCAGRVIAVERSLGAIGRALVGA
jgi:simple sugar transport system ATP-binding protein